MGLGVHMIQLCVLATTRLCRISHGAENVSLQRCGRRSRSVSKVLAMSQLNFVTVSNKFLIRCFQLRVVRILPDGPEIGHAKDDVGSLESSLERLDVVEIALDDFDSLGCPCFGGVGLGVASDATKGVAWRLEKGVCN